MVEEAGSVIRSPKNYVILVGKLEREPTIHRNPQGVPMAVLDLRTQNPETGHWNDFHNMIAFGGLAAWCEANLHSGMGICVHGQLALRRWKQGESWRSRPQVIVRQVFLAPMWGEEDTDGDAESVEVANVAADSTPQRRR